MGQILSKFAENNRALLSAEIPPGDETCPWADAILGLNPTSFGELEDNTIIFLSKIHVEQEIVTISDEE